MATIKIENLNKIYDNGFHAVHDFNLDIKDKEFIVLVGPSGCGKSTTLRTIAGIESISSGKLIIDGQVVNIASYSVKPGQIVAVREKSKSLEVIADALAGFNHSKYPWIEWDENSKSGKLLHKPERADIPENIKEQLIVELYSKN